MRLFGWQRYIKNTTEIRRIFTNCNEGIEIQQRTKRVFMQYICACSKFILHARENILVIFSAKKYPPPLNLNNLFIKKTSLLKFWLRDFMLKN